MKPRSPIQIVGYRYRYIGDSPRVARGLGVVRLYGWRHANVRALNEWAVQETAKRKKRARLSRRPIR